MAIPHYAHLVLKMSGPNGVISIKGDIKRVYAYNRESCEMTYMFLTSTELQELKKALAESHPDPIMPEAKTSNVSIQPEDNLSMMIPLSPDKPSKVALIGREQFGPQIETHAHQIPPGKYGHLCMEPC
jgi:hypothetical protein